MALIFETPKGLVHIPFNQIKIIHCNSGKCKIVTTDNELKIEKPLSKIKEKLNEQFFPCHRNCMVNIDYFESWDKTKSVLNLKDGSEVSVSARAARQLNKIFKKQKI